jgi:hypothetical protein
MTTPSAPITTGSFSYIIYKSGADTIAQKSDGSTLITSRDPDVAIRKVLEQPGPLDNPGGIRAGPGHVYIADGMYDLSPSFGGFDLRSFTHLTLGPQAVLRVSDTFTGNVFVMKSDDNRPLSDCTIDGGDIRQKGSIAQPQWTAILLHGVGNGGVLFNKVVNTTIRGAHIGIQLKATSDSNVPSDRLGIEGGWVNGNLIQGLKMWRNGIFIDFEMEGQYKPDTQITGIHRNRFVNIECQSGRTTTYGIRNIRHFGNSFINVNVWDIGEGGSQAIISNIHSDARGTVILSGIMTGQNFSDQGRFTKIIDEQNGVI